MCSATQNFAKHNPRFRGINTMDNKHGKNVSWKIIFPQIQFTPQVMKQREFVMLGI
jgi:hypothetical protein